MKYLLLLLLISPAAISARCLPVTGDRILGADLASADTKFAALPATLQFGYAPAPGGSRIFTGVELQRTARVNGIETAAFADVCFEVVAHIPTDSEFVAAIRPKAAHELYRQVNNLNSKEGTS